MISDYEMGSQYTVTFLVTYFLESVDPLNKMPIATVKEKFGFFSLIFFLHSIFNIEKKCVLTILKAINHKTINSKRLVLQNMEESRVS